jgi:hypothetical protein
MEKTSRRKLLVNLAATGAAAAGARTASARDRQRPNLKEQEARLRNVLSHLEAGNDHMNRVASGWTAPPDPDRPEFDALLNGINSECQSVMETANELLLRRGA